MKNLNSMIFLKNEVANDKEISKIALFEILKDKILSYKVSFIGADGVGKRTLSHYISKPQSFLPSFLDGEMLNKKLNILGLNILLQCWIFSSRTQFKKVLSTYLRGSSLVVLLYDITNFNTLSNIDELILMTRKLEPEPALILVGNKLDLEKERDVPKDTVIELCKDRKIIAYHEISSQTGENIEELFELITRILLKHMKYPKLEKEDKEFIKMKKLKKHKKVKRKGKNE